ncbi:hypothetical protein Thini_2976 [Thiothrix nivea DSM 5205]|uniref:Uncharacterized protein n=1 Tax=Thiothrix nivea (strain ATCC 35100 / DSM 5205 / JP2) TaxID=870187 RepID=A0A656HH20_THINJ|nr:hypothetical protein Thini_2976 [Thiothrix nivea DSM 5205]
MELPEIPTNGIKKRITIYFIRNFLCKNPPKCIQMNASILIYLLSINKPSELINQGNILYR